MNVHWERTVLLWCCVLSHAVGEVKKLAQVHKLGKAGVKQNLILW